MRKDVGRGAALGVALLIARSLGSTLAFAADAPVVHVKTEIILASNRGTTIDPPELEKMREQFSQKGFAFTSYRRLSSENLSLQKMKPVEIKLPNQRTATIRLDDIKLGTASLEIIISQSPSNVVISNTVLTLGREGSLFQHAGDYNGGQLILVVSPAENVKPRRAIGINWHLARPALRSGTGTCPEMTCCP